MNKKELEKRLENNQKDGKYTNAYMALTELMLDEYILYNLEGEEQEKALKEYDEVFRLLYDNWDLREITEHLSDYLYGWN